MHIGAHLNLMFNYIITKIILNIIPKNIRLRKVKIILNDKVFKLIIKKPQNISSKKFRKSLEKLYDFFK